MRIIEHIQNKDYLDFEPITIQEEQYFNKTNRGGISYGYPGIYDCTNFFIRRSSHLLNLS